MTDNIYEFLFVTVPWWVWFIIGISAWLYIAIDLTRSWDD
jgi:hypothetical protein